MFINDNRFKRAFKEAFGTTGLDLMNDGERLYISAPEWAIEVEKADIPNKMLAAIIECCGEVPACGHAFTAIKTECNQEAMIYSVWTPSEKYREDRARKVDKTPMFYKLGGCSEWRIMQLCDNGECILIESELLEMVDKRAIDEDKESFPQYPELCGEYLIWQNCMGMLAIKAKMPVYLTKEDEVMKKLQEVKLSAEQWSRATAIYERTNYAEGTEEDEQRDSED